MNVVELFSCAGGMAEGFRRADIPVTMAFDWDPDARASYAANHGHAPIGMDARDLERLLRAGWSPGHVDLFIGDPPCTPWSRAGKRRGIEDERDMLLVTVGIVRLMRPRIALIANVPGLDDAPNWPTVQATIGGLARDGYCVDFTRLDAADYGVAQHRIRPFWFLHPMESPHITWPARTHGPPGERNVDLFEPLKPWVTCRQALGHLSMDELGAPIRLRWRGQHGAKIASSPDEPARVVGTSSLSDGNILASETEATRAATRLRKKKTSKRPRASVVHSDAAGRLAPPGHHGKSDYADNRGHGPNAIKLSERAAALLQSFPPDWVFCGATKKSRWGQIGMAMPPVLAEAVARSIHSWLARS